MYTFQRAKADFKSQLRRPKLISTRKSSNPMGLSSSRLQPHELQELEHLTSCTSWAKKILVIRKWKKWALQNAKVTEQEITRLYKRFKTLDKDKKGYLTQHELLSIPELAMNPLANRILAVFDSNSGHMKGGEFLTFTDFLKCLSAFAPSTKRDLKLKCTHWLTYL